MYITSSRVIIFFNKNEKISDFPFTQENRIVSHIIKLLEPYEKLFIENFDGILIDTKEGNYFRLHLFENNETISDKIIIYTSFDNPKIGCLKEVVQATLSKLSEQNQTCCSDEAIEIIL